MSLMEQADQIRVQLGYSADLPLSQVIEKAEADLGLSNKQASGQPNMVERTALVMRTLGLSVGPAAETTVGADSITVVEGAVVPMPAVPAGTVVPVVALAAPVSTSLGTFTFASCTNNAFDTNGVLYALGSDFGRAGYTNPADSGKVRFGWSADAANYYSTNGGHKQGDAAQAARVICANAHPGANATMWSRGAPGAWFSLDLVSVELMPTHFAYRNDYGGGGNHPRSFELQGSNDGRSWTTLSTHSGEGWSGKQAKSWSIRNGGGGEQYYRMLRIVNKGSPNHLCCSGIEFYGHLRAAQAAPPPPSGPLRVIEARYGWAGNLWQANLGSGHNHGGGAKDVTSIVSGLIVDDELHINPSQQGQYMNRTFWPETAGGPPIPRKLAVRYAYGDGPEQTVETPAVGHETVALHVTRHTQGGGGGGGDNTGLLQTKDLEGCWICCCFPLMFWALFKKEATGPDSLKHAGCCFPFFLPFEEHRQRVAGTNGFHKVGEEGNVDMHNSESCQCNGLSCAIKLC